ncbi:unnamed protein product [Schistosoma margrebowiei]|uniref:Uncharacterized protein n=1 Tax=Schistosoma margrebowiei TaxID=48269 RepID=A0A3P7WNX1_9TREM|nr:unnamed protein product [Schistosoma margrebowiei]
MNGLNLFYLCVSTFFSSDQSVMNIRFIIMIKVSKTVIDLLDRPHKEKLIDLVKIAKHQNIHENVHNKTGINLSKQSNGGLISDSKLQSSVSSIQSKVEDENSIEPEMFIEYPSIKEETLAFCEFIKNLDGSSIDNPEPTTLASLFAGTHEAQPPVSTPINVVELINLPYELRHSIKEPPKLLCDKHSLTDSESLPRITKSNAAKRQEKVSICSRFIRYYKITILR